MNLTRQSNTIGKVPMSPAFHTISSEFFGAESAREQRSAFLFFTLFGLVTAWPIIMMIFAASRMLQACEPLSPRSRTI